MEILEVKRHVASEDYFVCLDKQGKSRRVDLLSSGCFPEETTAADLIGKVVRVEYTHPYIELAEGVELI